MSKYQNGQSYFKHVFFLKYVHGLFKNVKTETDFFQVVVVIPLHHLLFFDDINSI